MDLAAYLTPGRLIGHLRWLIYEWKEEQETLHVVTIGIIYSN